jgi:L-arabinose isomerase
MFNPLVDSLKDLTDSEVESKISELSRKYFLASRNPQLQTQVQTILEMYRLELESRIAHKKIKQDEENGNSGLDNLINIS